jgi:hypothetical protein
MYHRILLWQEPIILYKENVIQENSKDSAAGSYLVQEKCKDIAAGSCGSGIMQICCCGQLWFRKSVKTLLPAVVVQE